MDWMELNGAILSVWAVWLTARRHMLCWPVGIASVIVYAWVFIHARLYSDALLQGIFGVMIVYGWVRWSRFLDTSKRVRIAPLARRWGALHLALGVVGALVLGYIMQRWTDAALPWLDSTLTAFSLVGQWWEDRRHIACWWLWISVDTIYIGEYIYKDLDITAALYAGFLILAMLGLRHWKRAADAAREPAHTDSAQGAGIAEAKRQDAGCRSDLPG